MLNVRNAVIAVLTSASLSPLAMSVAQSNSPRQNNFTGAGINANWRRSYR